MKFTPNSENTSQIKCKCRDKEGTKTRQQSQEEDGGEDWPFGQEIGGKENKMAEIYYQMVNSARWVGVVLLGGGCCFAALPLN